MAGEPLTPEQEAELKRLLRLAELAGSKGEKKVQLEALRKAKELRANRTLTDDIVDFVKFDPARVAGRTGRALAEGTVSLVDVATSPIKAVGNMFGAQYTGDDYRQAVSDALPESMFPKPRPGPEQVVDTSAQFVAGAFPFVKGGQMISRAPGLLGNIGKDLASNPSLQAASASTAGVAGEMTRQEGGSPLMQFGASLLGGLVPAGLRGTVNTARSMLPAGKEVEQVLANVDLSGLSIASVKRLEGAVSQALKFGELDPAALARLIEFERVGATPTQASVSLDPIDKTQQKNLSKVGAQSSNPNLQRLANIEADNNRALVGTLDDLANQSNLDPYTAGRSAIDPVTAKQQQWQKDVGNQYTQARGTEGRALPLDRTQFMENLNQRLVAGNLIHYLPKEVKKMINDIAYGQVKDMNGDIQQVPFNVDTIDTLKSMLAAEQRSAQGSAKQALAEARNALEDTQLQGGAPDEAILAFDKARAANRALRQWEESAPGIEAIVNGATPDTFMDKFILSKTAGVDDVKKIIDVVKGDPDAFNALKFQVAAWIRDKAAPTLIEGQGRLNSASLNRALKQIGDRKLALFFSPDEIKTIKATNNVAFYDAYQPPGSAVNNSSSGTMLTGGLLNAISDRSPTARLIGSGMKGLDAFMFNPGRARQQLTPNVMQGGARPPLLPSMATPLALTVPAVPMPLLPQPDR